MKKINPAKLLLFGEYGIVLGGDALAVPFREQGGSFQRLNNKIPGSQLDSHNHLKVFLTFLQENGFDSTLDLKSFEADIREGMYFKSAIPVGYGLGSSGALCAAVTSRYGHENLTKELFALKTYFSSMESFFHGRSSGVDPLVSYLNKPLWFQENTVKIIAAKSNGVFEHLTQFLVDTGRRSETAPLVEKFLQSMKGSSYANRIKEEYIPMNHKLIQDYISGHEGLYAALEKLSVFQLDYFRDMIPTEFVDIWRYGLLNKKYALKLCGSGGGGYLLGFSLLPEEELKMLFNHLFGHRLSFLKDVLCVQNGL